MVIDDLNTLRMAVPPEKADPPLVIDANAIRSLAIPLQHFESIRRRQPKIFQPRSRINRIELHERPLLNLARESFHEFALKDSLGIGITKRLITPNRKQLGYYRQSRASTTWLTQSASVCRASKYCCWKNQAELRKPSSPSNRAIDGIRRNKGLRVA